MYLPFDFETRLESHRQELLSEADMQRGSRISFRTEAVAYNKPSSGAALWPGREAGPICPSESRRTTTLTTSRVSACSCRGGANSGGQAGWPSAVTWHLYVGEQFYRVAVQVFSLDAEKVAVLGSSGIGPNRRTQKGCSASFSKPYDLVRAGSPRSDLVANAGH